MVSIVGQEITRRFFEAVVALKAIKAVRGQKTISTEMGVENSSMYKIKNHPETYTLKPEYIYHLVSKYKISADWLITGRGRMFSK